MRGVVSSLGLVLLVACGARSGLDVEVRDAGSGSDPAPVGCLRDRDCSDGVQCTDDRCVGGRCVVTALDARCDDGVHCNGAERCALGVGCVGEPVRCDDGVSCTADACDEEARACVHRPEVERCPISYRCDPVLDCVARALAHDPGALFEVDLPSGAIRRVASTDVSLTDLALHPDGRLFGVTRDALFLVHEETGRARWLANVPERLVALEVGPDRALYGAGPSDVVRIDPETYAVTRIASLPSGVSASGDVAFVGERLYVSATRTPFSTTEPDVLLLVSRSGAGVAEVGSIGVACVWGLAPFGDTLYGLTCTGQLVVIDVDTAEGRVLRAALDARFGGAAAR